LRPALSVPPDHLLKFSLVSAHEEGENNIEEKREEIDFPVMF